MGLMKMFSIWLQKGLDPVTMSPPQAHSGGAGGEGPEEQKHFFFTMYF